MADRTTALMKSRFIWICMLIISLPVAGQGIHRYNAFTYNVNEGLLQSTITNIEIDRDNFCWISFPNGLQRFDGRSFVQIPVQPGLPDDKLCRLFRTSDGQLLISHSQGISRYNGSSDRFISVLATGTPGIPPARFIGEHEGIIYFYSPQGSIAGIRLQDYSVMPAFITGLPAFLSNPDEAPVFAGNSIQHQTAFMIRQQIFIWSYRDKRVRFKSDPLPGVSLFYIRMFAENEVMVFQHKEKAAFQIFRFPEGTSRSLPVYTPVPLSSSRLGLFYHQNKILLFVNEHLYETDSSLQNIKAELVNFQNQPLAGGHYIAGIREDQYGNLIIQTVTGGIRKVQDHSYPIRFYHNEAGEKNFITALLPDKARNRVLAGVSGGGLQIYDTLQKMIAQFPLSVNKTARSTPNTILRVPAGGYLIFTAGEKQAWYLRDDLSAVIPWPVSATTTNHKRGPFFFGKPLWQDANTALVQNQELLYKIQFGSRTIRELAGPEGYIMSGLFLPPCVLIHNNDQLLFLDTGNFAVRKTMPLPHTGYVRCYAAGPDGRIYIGSNKGIFVTDTTGHLLRQINNRHGLPDECIYAIAFDEQGTLWCSTNKGILKLVKGELELQLRKEDGLQENEFNTNIVARADDGELFFGGVNGISSFYPAAISRDTDQIRVLITRISVNNEELGTGEAPWHTGRISLPYDRNALAIDFLAMGYQNPDQYVYQYRMEGMDREWIPLNGLQTVRYSLPPGRYVLHMYASRSFNNKAEAQKSIIIIIRPPFWKTWWFRTGLGLLLLVLLYYFISRRTRQQYTRRLQQLENERQLKLERERISKDLHDSLGAYAHAVLYTTELLDKENTEAKRKELVGDLKFASKDIITSLRETVWALKKDEYTAEECLVRIRNFIQPLSKYYSPVQFRVEGEAPAGRILHYTAALNLVRILQEAISNSIKHAKADCIRVHSETSGQQWKLTVQDDGLGFNPGELPEEEKGNGLYNMQHRAAASGFGYSIQSEKNKGTTITLIL